jgi:formylglycine-generating enzyme required for sulfatase activity
MHDMFQKWLDEGCVRQRKSEQKLVWKLQGSGATEEKVLRQLRNASPPEGVRLVGALAATSQVSHTACNEVETHPHWMVRFAGFLSGLCKPLGRAAEDENHWVKQLGLDNLIGELVESKPTFDPSSVLVENEKDGTLLLLIPGGEYLAGGGDAGPFRISLPQFRLAIHPVSNEQFQRFAIETHRDENWKPRAKPDHPAVNVTWHNAKAYCEWAGLRLPRELEWEKGARWVDGREAAWGRAWNDDYCRSGNSQEKLEIQDLLISQGVDLGTATVWSYPKGCSPWGLYQMTGNVWEWCEDSYEENVYENRYRRGDLALPTGGAHRVQKGGSWFDRHVPLFHSANRIECEPESRKPYCGFRCAL